MSDGWFQADEAGLAQVPAWLRSWLGTTGSLTQRLKSCCSGEFSLEVIAERDGVLDADEATAMGLPVGTATRIREVHLRCDGEPCIYARSLIPHETLAGAGKALGELGARPLGDALFAYGGLDRSDIEIAWTKHGWGRRSVFRIEGAPVLVSEFFLDALQRCTD